MRVRFPAVAVMVLVGLLGMGGLAQAQQTMKQEFDVGLAPIEDVRLLLKDALSPQGKFVMLSAKNSILVIDTPEGIIAVQRALAAAGAKIPKPDVALNFRFQTGLASRRSKIEVTRQLPLPTEYTAPTIIVGPNGPIGVIPSTPTKFEMRDIGTVSDTTTRMNRDGSLTVDVNLEHTEFEGFINYGSAILPNNGIGAVPVANGVGNPQFFGPFINTGGIFMPIISTTRISTSVVIRPRVAANVVHLDMMPQLVVAPNEDEAAQGVEDLVVNLPQFQTTVAVEDDGYGRAHGFPRASEEFNRRFFNAKLNDKEGAVAITVQADFKPPGTAKKAMQDAAASESESPGERQAKQQP
jgi:hypothetical protein